MGFNIKRPYGYKEILTQITNAVDTVKNWCDGKFSLLGHKHSDYSDKDHKHEISDVNSLQQTLNEKATSNHTHSEYAPSSHTHPQSDVIGLAAALAGKAPISHTHANMSFASAPDYSRSVLLKTINSSNNKGFPVWKLNVPGYLHAFGMRNDHNQDTMFVLSDDPSKLINREKFEDGKFLVISGMTSDGDSGGSCGPSFVYPGTSTYFVIAGGNLGYHITFTPCFGVPTLISSSNFCTETSYTITENTTSDLVNGDDKLYIITPGSASWKRMFNNNWRANFPNINWN